MRTRKYSRRRIHVLDHEDEQGQPSPLFGFFTERDRRDILTHLSRFIPGKEMMKLSLVNKAAFNNMTLWLDDVLGNPLSLLKLLSVCNRREISRLLQTYFYPDSCCRQKLQSHLQHPERYLPAYACLALINPLNSLDGVAVQQASLWLAQNEYPWHLINSLNVVVAALQPRADNRALVHELRKATSREYLPYLNLQGLDLHRCDLTGINFTGANLKFANLSQAHFPGMTFTLALLTGANLADVYAYQADFSFACMQYANMQRGVFSTANFTETNLSFADLSNANMVDIRASGMKLQGANLDFTCMMNASMPDSNLHRADMNFTSFQGSNLSGSDISEAKGVLANILAADMRYMHLSKVAENFLFKKFAKFSTRDEVVLYHHTKKFAKK